MAAKQRDVDYDVIIVGAGISGINFAYRLQERNPDLTYCILEGRHEIGGTWSLFKYPGIRSDSDLFTFGFAWRPWTAKNAIADGSLILNYLKESARQEDIDRKIMFNHRVNESSWSSSSKTWTLSITKNNTTPATLRSRFVMFGTGYYDYNEALKAPIPGIENFKGTVIHPQFWPTDLDYSNKNIVVIGSGATAVTLLPNIARDASHVTMLQRSPTYIRAVPAESQWMKFARRYLPTTLAYSILRFTSILWFFLFRSFCMYLPKIAREVILRAIRAQVPESYSMDPHFTPAYYPGEQRLCLCPDGDFFESLKTGRGSVKTDTIKEVLPRSIQLNSGDELHPDIIVTATGLKLESLGGIILTVDGQHFDIGSHFAWNGAMVEDLPNAILGLGYVDSSWTLGADATAHMACRLLRTMKLENVKMITPRRTGNEKQNMEEMPFLRLNSTYVKKQASALPKTGNHSPWNARSHYWKDMGIACTGDLKAGMEWTA